MFCLFFLSFFVCPLSWINLVFFIISSYLLCCFITCSFVPWLIFSGCFRVYSVLLYLTSLLPSHIMSLIVLYKNLTTIYKFLIFPLRVFALLLPYIFTSTCITVSDYNALGPFFFCWKQNYISNILMINKYFIFPYIFAIFIVIHYFV